MKREVSGSGFAESCTPRWKITWIEVGQGKGERQGPSPDRGVMMFHCILEESLESKSGKREGRSGQSLPGATPGER